MTTDLVSQIDALKTALAQERDARALAEADVKAGQEKMAVLAHEIKTPLGAFLTMCEQLDKSPLDETQKSFVSTLRTSATGLLAVVNDTLQNAKSEGQKVDVRSDQLDLHAFINMFAYESMLEAAHKQLGFDLEVDPNCPQFVFSDEGRLRQMLSNYMSNALKFTDEGAVTLKVKAEAVEAGKAFVRFEVHDTGIGISSEDKVRLFAPYVQAASTAERNRDGTGLGLHIVKQLATSMGGDCGCASIEGEGSAFWFSVLVSDQPVTVEKKEESVKRPVVAEMSGRVLIVDDNELNQLIVRTYLDEFGGISYDCVSSGAQAIAHLESGQYDLVLMDVMMPGQDGVETTRQIRSSGASFSSVPIVALTARADALNTTDYIYAGMNDCLSKPVSAETLYKMLEQYLCSTAPLQEIRA